MILADKISYLRKQQGWSQEELADRIGVSRQAISKWESGQSVPDMKKIIKLSEEFQVSTDYLLKDEMETPTPPPEGYPDDAVDNNGEHLHPVSMEEANAYLAQTKKNASQISLGVLLCILSPIVLCVLACLAEKESLPISETTAYAIGIMILIALIVAAVALFIPCGIASSRYDYLKQENLDTAYGVDGMVREQKNAYTPHYIRGITIGVALCIISVIPEVITEMIPENQEAPYADAAAIAFLLLLVGAGVYCLVNVAIIWDSFNVLLESGDYTRGEKAVQSRISSIYWGIATALYLLISFITMEWSITWIIWPIAGILYGVIVQISLIRHRQ